MDHQLLAQYAAPVPRYTSYPTAPHFHAGVEAGVQARWLSDLARSNSGSADGRPRLSLYIHIPFCDRLCWFCGCTTKQTHRYTPVARYLESLYVEIDRVAGHLAGQGVVTALHLGGGSPTLLTPNDMRALNERLRAAFEFAADAEISVEMDPNDLDEARYDALADIGVTRASLGVQDFNHDVQVAINRLQSFEQTAQVVEAMRARGVASVNLDVLYGLPHQSVQTIAHTLKDVLSLSPDRVALFGYAHVPWMKKHQTMIDETVLPGVPERFAQQQHAAGMLTAAGYEAIGIDHFARPDDSLARANREGTLRRNFQGYTTDNAEALIGLGASSVSQYPQGYVQNTPASGDYAKRIDAGGLAGVRGLVLSDEDRLRGFVIEELMCRYRFSASDLKQRFGRAADPLLAEAELLVGREPNQYFVRENNEFVVVEAGRHFVRSIAAHFDNYLQTGKARHSVAV